MLFPEICDCLNARIYYSPNKAEELDIHNITAGDLMSEVLVFDKDNVLLVTALNSEQVLRTAAMVDALGVVLVNSKEPSERMISLAEELGVFILSTELPMFDTCIALNSCMVRTDPYV